MLEIITYPNKLLFTRSEEVTHFDAKLHSLLDDMYETMTKSSGIGLAAIQVASPIRVFLINLLNDKDIQDKADLIEFINPRITPIGTGTQIYEEGCLSVPGFFEEVVRFDKIRVDYQNRFGEHKSLEADGLLAVAIQHENDHLDGHLFIEKLNFTGRKRLEKHLKNSKKSKKSKA